MRYINLELYNDMSVNIDHFYGITVYLDGFGTNYDEYIGDNRLNDIRLLLIF